MAKNYYELHVAGCTRQLPILPVSDTLSIAGFVILGDTEIVTRASEELAARVPKDTDIIMTAETKGIPLAAELARVLGMKRYIVARKSVKAYMQNPIWVEDESITTKGKQRLYLMDTDVEMLHGKNVLLWEPNRSKDTIRIVYYITSGKQIHRFPDVKRIIRVQKEGVFQGK